MKSFVIIISFIPAIISIVLLCYLIANKMLNYMTSMLVGLMMFMGAAFVLFIKIQFDWSDVGLSDIIAPSISIVIYLSMLVLLPVMEIKNDLSIRSVFLFIKNYNFPTKALLLYFGTINLIILFANIARYKM